MNIKKLLIEQAENFPDKAAFIFEDNPVNFLELKDAAFSFANFLISRGITKEDRVVIFLPNIPEAIYSFLGTLSIGACIVPLDFMLTESEVINFINHSEASLLVAQPKKSFDLENIKKNCPSLKDIVVCSKQDDKFTGWNDIPKNYEIPAREIEENSLAAIFYTSGSTGHPKGVMLSFKHLDNPINCMNYILDISFNDTLLCGGVPFSHIGGIDYILVMLATAQTFILMERFQPLEFLRNIEKYKVTWFWIVPAMYVAILSLKDAARFDLSSLRYAVVFGAPSSPALLKRFHRLCPQACLLNGWGMTETSAPNCVLPPGVDKVASVGKFYPGMQAKIVDEKGNSLGSGERGHLLVKGEGVMLGYYKEPQLTREVLAEDGWLKTGDVAYYDEDGLFYIVGRIKDMIKVAGEIVFTPEVEDKIHRHPKVKEVAVIGVPDKLRGEVPKAFIVAKEGENIDPDELKEFLREHLAHFKIPHYFEFVDELPKTRTGKIDKKALVKS